MEKPQDLKAWPYNLISEALGIKSVDQADWASFAEDPAQVIQKLFNSVRYQNQSIHYRDTVNRALGAILDHYERGEKVVDAIKENGANKKIYYQILQDVYTGMRSFIYDRGPKKENRPPEGYVRRTRRYQFDKRPTPSGHITQSPDHDLLSNQINYDLWPWKVFKAMRRRDLINLLPDPDMVGDEITHLVEAICKGLDKNKPGQGEKSHIAFFGLNLEGKSADTIAGMYRTNRKYVYTWARKVTEAMEWYSRLYPEMFPDTPLQMDHPGVLYLAERGIVDGQTLSKYVPDQEFIDYLGAVAVSALNSRITSNGSNYSPFCSKVALMNSTVARTYDPATFLGVDSGVFRTIEKDDLYDRLHLTKPGIEVLAGVTVDQIIRAHVRPAHSGVIFELLDGRYAVHHKVYEEPQYANNIKTAQKLFYAPEGIEVDDTVVQLYDKPEPETVTVTITIPKGTVPGYFVAGKGFFFVDVSESQEVE